MKHDLCSESSKQRRPSLQWTVCAFAIGISLALCGWFLFDFSFAPRRIHSPIATDFNHAAFANGARIVDSFTTDSLSAPFDGLYTTTMQDRDVDLQVNGCRGPPSVPEIALGLFVDSRALWFFAGTQGVLTVAFPSPVLIQTMRLKGHPARLSCLPRDFNIWGLVVPPDAARANPDILPWPDSAFPMALRAAASFGIRSSTSLLASSSEPHWIPMGQFGEVQRNTNFTDINIAPSVLDLRLPVHLFAVEFRQNWGEQYTCFAGLSIYSPPDA